MFEFDLGYANVGKAFKSVVIPATALSNVYRIDMCLNGLQRATLSTSWKAGEDFDTADFVGDIPTTYCPLHMKTFMLILYMNELGENVTSETKRVTEKNLGCHEIECMHCKGSGYYDQDGKPCSVEKEYDQITYKFTVTYDGVEKDEKAGDVDDRLVKMDEDSFNMLYKVKNCPCAFVKFYGFNNDAHSTLDEIKNNVNVGNIDDDIQYFKSRSRWNTAQRMASEGRRETVCY